MCETIKINVDNSHDQASKDIIQISKIMIIILFFCLLELWGHWHSNSLSLLADSIHLFVDIIGFLVSLISLSLTKLKTNDRYTFGYHRFEVIGALISIFSIWIATGYLLFESIARLKNPQIIDEKSFILIAIIGFLVNCFCLYSLHFNENKSNNERNLNMKATYVHIIGDLIQSSGVLVASMLTFLFPKIIFFDIAATLIFACIVIISTFFVIRDAINILLEKVPKKINMKDLKFLITEQKKIIEILDLKVWSISVSKHAAMMVLKTNELNMNEYKEILENLKKNINEIYNFTHLTIQLQPYEVS